jgi:hypothetical protein
VVIGKMVQRMINRNIYDIPTIQEGDNEEDDQGIRDDAYQEDECVGGNVVHVEDANNEEPIAIDGLYVQLDGLEFINDNMLNEDHVTNSDDEEELSSHDDTDYEHEQSFQATLMIQIPLMMICVKCKHHFGISKKSINIFSEQLLYIYIYIFLYFWCFVFCKLPYVVSKALV